MRTTKTICVRSFIQQVGQRHARQMQLGAANNKTLSFSARVRKELPWSPVAHTRRFGMISSGEKGHIWDEFVASHPGDGAMRSMATELLGEDKVLHLIHVEAMEQRPTVDCAEDDRLIRMSIAAMCRRGDAHRDGW